MRLTLEDKRIVGKLLKGKECPHCHSFGQLTIERDEKARDMEAKCLVCGYRESLTPREQLPYISGGFDHKR